MKDLQGAFLTFTFPHLRRDRLENLPRPLDGPRKKLLIEFARELPVLRGRRERGEPRTTRTSRFRSGVV
ncbi:MAG: hypothetical protein G01um101438_689 [Parcubacteria group bacterium Gr01-1014_38]|nr:MAG: hypothetical protein G01um101438_689 [Parcubacteria group bacterium Gr01-1014_38]